ncbi:YigZ family protein [Ulvibacterium sp.]|uniref:IMPACT family protein n=1 Tax=Ulvibacterium sp. TaxID=2665914 RepID=UPI00261B6F63|nr:YigZ family protein [Ulvibacterium sp.]
MERKPNSYKTLARPSEVVIFTDKKSRFYGYAFPVDTVESIKPLLEELRKKYPKANHVCYAWQLGADEIQYRANDDGEPRNSAGSPIHGQIQSFEITNVIVAVVRFFGGTKLGVGGLINAYRSTARMALEASSIVEKRIKIRLKLTFDYVSLNKVMHAIKRQKLEIISQNLELDCSITLLSDKKDLENTQRTLIGIQGLKIEILT